MSKNHRKCVWNPESFAAGTIHDKEGVWFPAIIEYGQSLIAILWRGLFSTGRILNRFSKDIGFVDDMMPFTCCDFLQVTEVSAHRSELRLVASSLFLFDFKQSLDEVFVISRIVKVQVGVTSRSRRLRLIIFTETLIILVFTKTESNNCFIIHWATKKWLRQLLTASNTKRMNLTWLPLEIMRCGHTWHDYPWPWVSLTW